MVYVVVLFEWGFCDGCHGALSFGVRQHHVLLEPAESGLFQHHTALDRVPALACCPSRARESTNDDDAKSNSSLVLPGLGSSEVEVKVEVKLK